MRRIVTWLIYLYEYLKFGDFLSIYYGIRYLIDKTSCPDDRIIKTSIGTFFCRKNTNDFQFANYRYEWSVKRFVIDSLRDYDVFIDAGACIGDYSILVAKKGIKCISFEPVKENFEILQKNISLNGLEDKIQTLNIGLGTSDGTFSFVFDPVNTGASHISGNQSDSSHRVELRLLDTLLPLLHLDPDDRILVKLDVEGMEPDVVTGAREFIRRHKNLMFILEDKLAGKDEIIKCLDRYAIFSYGTVDDANFYALKTGDLN